MKINAKAVRSVAQIILVVCVLLIGSAKIAQAVVIQLPPGNELTKRDINKFNPLVIDKSPVANAFNTPGTFISRVLLYAIPLAGLILFVMIVWGGFEILSGASTAKSKEAGQQRVTSAIIGFLLLFASYWIVQIIQIVFGVRILG